MTPLTQRCRRGLTMPMSSHSLGTYPETSSHATHQGILGHCHRISQSHCGPILAEEWNQCAQANSHFKKKKKCRQGMNGQTFSPNPRKREKSQHHHQLTNLTPSPKFLRSLQFVGIVPIERWAHGFVYLEESSRWGLNCVGKRRDAWKLPVIWSHVFFSPFISGARRAAITTGNIEWGCHLLDRFLPGQHSKYLFACD